MHRKEEFAGKKERSSKVLGTSTAARRPAAGGFRFLRGNNAKPSVKFLKFIYLGRVAKSTDKKPLETVKTALQR